MSQGYAITNMLSGLAAASFTWSSGYTTSRTRLNDGILDEIASSAASAQASGQTLVIDLGSAQIVNAWALLNHNLASGACTVRVRSADDAGISVNVYTAKAATTIVTTAPNQKDTILQLLVDPAANVAKRYWELTFVHTGTKIVTIGEVLAFASITALSRVTIYGAGEEERYIQNRNESRTGHVRTTFVGGPVRTKNLPFKDLSGTSQRNELLTMWRATQGGVANLLWVEFIEANASAATAAGQECLWGLLEESIAWTQDDYLLFNIGGLKLIGQGREVGS